MRALRGILEALEPPEWALARGRAGEEIDAMGSKGSIERTARVTGPGGTVVIPLRLVGGGRPAEVRRLDDLVRLATGTDEGQR